MYSSDGDTQFEEDCQEKLLNKRRKESNGKEEDLIYQYSTKIFAYCFQAPLKQYSNVWTNRYC